MLRKTIQARRAILKAITALTRAAACRQPDSPIAIQYTPDSVLLKPPAAEHPAYYVGRRSRYATCVGVAWFHGTCLAMLNLLGNTVHTYKFDSSVRTFTLMQSLVNMKGLVLPENLAFSPDGDLLAVTNSIDGAVNLYGVDRETHLIDPTPVACIEPGAGVNSHGVSFSPCSRFLFYSTVEDPGSLRCFRITRNFSGGIELIPMQVITNRFAPLKPKGVAFSPDGRFIAISYGGNAEQSSHVEKTGFLAVYTFDASSGCSLDPVCVSDDTLGLRCAEDVNFFPDASRLFVTDQTIDAALVVEFDNMTGTIGERRRIFKNPWGRLSFPHGNAISPDGKYLAVANCGDDKANIYVTPDG